MQIIEVNDKKTANEFLLFPVKLYKDEPNWIRPLDKDINGVFDPNVNKFFRNGECARWILKNGAGKVIGRIAAFINKKTVNKDNDQPTGGVGFFECIEDQEAANLLFDTGKNWLSDRGMEAMDGPINFGDRDNWWGLLVDGFDREPNYQCNYNFQYYQQLFENYGFQVYFKQFTFGRNTMDPLNPRLKEKADHANQDPEYSFRHIEKSKLKKYAEDFRTVYNDAWARHPGVAEMTSLQANAIIKKLKPIMDEKIMWFGYHKDKPVGFYINIPELNQVFKHVNGKLDLIGKLKFLYHKIRKTNKKMIGLVFGISPKHQGKGVDGALIHAIRVMVQEKYKRYPQLEMNWIGDFNPKMLKVVDQVGGEVVKTHHTYRFLFDRTKEFKRMPIKK
ncbi:hypothetical protein [Ekhidna sp. To15]|uniref:hypothetical protein n=1 Tax=Ekhidna sp. To15 TaxID=3395267 RepID=UPI003F528425